MKEELEKIKEKLREFHPLKYKGKLTQASFDLFEEIEETLYDEDIKEDNIIWATRYNITTMIEICNPILDDYKWLKEMLEIIDKYGG